MVALQVMIVHPVEQFVTGPVSGGFGLVCAAAGGDDKNKESSKSIAQNPTNFDAIFIVDHPCSGLSGKTSMFREGGAMPSHHSRKINHAATRIKPKPAQWFHFNACPR